MEYAYKTNLLDESRKIINDFLDLHSKLGTSVTLDHEHRRKIANDFFLGHSGNLETINKIEEFYIDSTEDKFHIPVRLYEYNNREEIILFAHGGGWVQGNLQTHDYLCRKMAKMLNINILSIDYRLAPEYAFPIPLNDVLSVYLWCCKKYNKIYLSGDSAGGNLCASACIKISDKNIRKADAMILFYPVLGSDFQTISYSLFGHLPSLSQLSMMYFLSQYSGHVCDNTNTVNDKYVSPNMECDMNVFPKTLLISAGCDVLLSHQLEFATKMQRFKNDCEQIILEGAIHGFMTYGKEFEQYNTNILMNVSVWIR
ncbi:MAG: alpha/beta hydrolase [Bacteroidales bacterium]|nr:alpha/beta hydrolase [Bacteroidales bacterium]